MALFWGQIYEESVMEHWKILIVCQFLLLARYVPNVAKRSI